MTLSRRRFLQTTAGLGLASLAGISPAQTQATIVVIGGGYGGMTACKYLRLNAPELKIILVEPKMQYVSCPGSNAVIANLASYSTLEHDYQRSLARYSIRHIRDKAQSIDYSQKRVQLESGRSLAYDRVIVSPGIRFLWDETPGYNRATSRSLAHAWQAGPQTKLLQTQLKSLKPGGTAIISVPPAPYRCPPGPYERASLFACYLKQKNPTAKILIIDANNSFTKQALFQDAWQRLYPGMIEWIPAREEGPLERLDPDKNILYTEFGKHQGDLINFIPPQQAAEIAQQMKLTDASGWCPVDPLTFESTLQPGIHVIGDAAIIPPMPKSAFAANSQAKACAAAVVSLLEERAVPAQPLINACYSFLDDEQAISVVGVYRYENDTLITTSSGVTPMEGNFAQEAKAAHGWYRNFHNDVFE